MQFKVGNFEAALEAIEECIKISQNKNDADTILDCSVWLYSISGSIGGEENFNQQRLLLEHLIV